MSNDKSKKMNSWKHKGVSPILATVVLLGITVVGGGIAFAFFSTSATTASVTDVIAIQNAQAVKGSDHSDLTATVKNAGTQPWVKVEMTVSKSELSEPILYESLHEVVAGCKSSTAGDCVDGTNESTQAGGGRDNPLRAQWLISLDKTGGSTNVADPGEGAAAGRKLVFDNKDDSRTITILNGTAVAPLFNADASDATSGNNPGSIGAKMQAFGITSACNGATACANVFKALDSSTKGDNFHCTEDDTNDDIAATCTIYTHQNIEDDPVSAGESIYFYADAFTQEIPGLNNQVVRVGDNIVVNLFTENKDGGTARVQTIIKVSGI